MRLQPVKAAFAAAAAGKLQGLAAASAKFWSTTDTMAVLVAGAVLVRWLADHLEPWGLGEGLSLIICTSITTRAQSFHVTCMHRGQSCQFKHLTMEVSMPLRANKVQASLVVSDLPQVHSFFGWLP